MSIYPDGTSGIWEISNHDAIYPSGFFTNNRVNSDCGGCFSLYTDFKKEEIYNNNTPGSWIRYTASGEPRGIGLSDLMDEFYGRSGVYEPGKNTASFWSSLSPCSLESAICNGPTTPLAFIQMSGGYSMQVGLYVDSGRRMITSIANIFSSGIQYPVKLQDYGPIGGPDYFKEKLISDISFSGSSISIEYADAFFPGSGWQELTVYRDNFYKVYGSGNYAPDAFPSGLLVNDIIYSITKLSFNNNELLVKTVSRPIKASYNFGYSNPCEGSPGEPSGYLDFVYLDPIPITIGPTPIASGFTIYGPPINNAGYTNSLIMTSGVYLDYLGIDKLACSGVCNVNNDIIQYDKFFNKSQPVLKYHYNYGSSWTTAILNQIDDVYYESNVITHGTGEFKVHAELQGDTLFHFWIRRSLPLPVDLPYLQMSYECFPKRSVIGYDYITGGLGYFEFDWT